MILIIKESKFMKLKKKQSKHNLTCYTKKHNQKKKSIRNIKMKVQLKKELKN